MWEMLFRAVEYGFANCIVCIREMDYLHLLLLSALAVGLAVAIIGCVRHSLRHQMEALWGCLSMVCVAVVFFLCIVASAQGTLVFAPDTRPEETVDAFFTALLQGDAAAAEACLATPAALFLDEEAPTTGDGGMGEDMDLMAAQYAQALRESYSYEVAAPIEISGISAVQSVRFTSLDLLALPAAIHQDVTDALAVLVETHRKSDIYDEEENYRADVLESVYQEAVDAVLQEARRYYVTTQLQVRLSYRDGVWYVQPDAALQSALHGGAATAQQYANNAKSEALSGLIYLPKHYAIAEGVTVAPAPVADGYGTTSDLEEVRGAIAGAARLIDGRELFFDETAQLTPELMHYYADDTIFFLAWKELYEDHYCTFAEVFIADGSQLRRKLAEDSYGTSVQKTASDLAREANAVIAMNGDFYKFRTEGITVYDRTLYRFRPQELEFCHIDTAGDMRFTYAGELGSEEEARQYLIDNDVIFTLAFGPVLVADGQKRDLDGYLLGQVRETYSRSAIGQRGTGHYLLMNINYGYNAIGATIYETANIMYDKGCENAYALDGGQTAEIVVDGDVYNNVDYGNERMVSDIIYFATALPEEER